VSSNKAGATWIKRWPLTCPPEIVHLAQLAIIAQLQLWEAVENLESLLEGEYVSGSDEHRACKLWLTDAIATIASEPDKSIPEILAAVSAEELREMLIEMAEPKA